MDSLHFIIGIGTLAAGLVVAWFFLRGKSLAVAEKARAEIVSELAMTRERLASKEQALHEIQQKSAEIEHRFRHLEERKNVLERDLAVAVEKNARVPALEDALCKERSRIETLQEELTRLSSTLAKETEKSEQLGEHAKALPEKEKQLELLRSQLSEQKTYAAEIETRLAEERKQAEEKLALLTEAKNQLAHQFKALAHEIFEEKSKSFSEQSRDKLDALLLPFREQMSEFRKKVDDVYVNEAKERASLKKELETLRDLNQKINQEAINLTRALKGDKKAQGNWGEMILERVLEQSGLRKGVEYETQTGLRDDDNKILKPDVIIHLPEGKDIIVDSKVSLLAYERYCSAADENARAKELKDHVQAIRNHIDTLSSKYYAHLKDLRSLDFVLMFMPIESAFMAACQHDERLFSHAFERRIVVVTPTTLLATLRTVENIWRYERQNQNALAIADRASAIYDKLRLFVEDMEKLGRQLDTAHSTFDSAMNKLTMGHGNLISQANRFVELGIKVKKPLSKPIADRAEMDAPEESPTENPPVLGPKINMLPNRDNR